MGNLRRRIHAMEKERVGEGRIFFTTVADKSEDECAAYLAAERERLGIGERDMHFVTIYEPKPVHITDR